MSEVRRDITVRENDVVFCHGGKQSCFGLEAVTSVEERCKMGVDTGQRAKLAVEIVSDRSRKEGFPVSREGEEDGSEPGVSEPGFEQFGLRVFAGSIDAFEGNDHGGSPFSRARRAQIQGGLSSPSCRL